MPDLGKYADAVLSSYAVALVLLFLLVAQSIWRGRKARAELAEIERKRQGNA